MAADTYLYFSGAAGPMKVKATDQGDGTYALATVRQASAAGLVTNVSVGTTASALPSSALTGRRLVRISNPATPYGYPCPIYVGYANTIVAGVSAAAGAAGRMIPPGQTADFVVQAGQALYGITTTQTQVAQVEEFA